MTEVVKVDVQCPFCGICYTRFAKLKPCSINCRGCSMSLHLKWVGDTPTSTNKAGFGRLAYEPFNHNEDVKDLNEVFAKV